MHRHGLTMLLAVILAVPIGARAQGASLAGTVMAEPGEFRLANAEVMLTDIARSTRSDSDGNFTLADVPAGKHALVVRLVGYESFNADITFGVNQRVEADFFLKAIVTKLTKVEVRDKATLANSRLAEFEDRRHGGAGRYLTADVFEKAVGRRVSDIVIGKFPGVRSLCGTSGCSLYSTRGGVSLSSATSQCFMKIVVNGLPMQGRYNIDSIDAADVIGLEFYTVATTPLQYGGTGGMCGTVLVWTK